MVAARAWWNQGKFETLEQLRFVLAETSCWHYEESRAQRIEVSKEKDPAEPPTSPV